MRIISKHKDYYDYLQGIYGVDNNLVYNRKVNSNYTIGESDDDALVYKTFAIAGNIYKIYIYKKKIYHTIDEMVKLYTILPKDLKKDFVNFYTPFKFGKGITVGESLEKTIEYLYKETNIKTDINKLRREPVLIFNSYYRYEKDDDKDFSNWDIPLLNDYKFCTIFPAQEMYIKISTFFGWLKDNPEIKNNQSDLEKLTSHGFDKKKSFRHRK